MNGSLPPSARGMRIDDPKLCAQQLAEALSWDGPAIIECVTDEHEPPYPAKIKQDQVRKLVGALRDGTPNRRRIAQMTRTCSTNPRSRQARPMPSPALSEGPEPKSQTSSGTANEAPWPRSAREPPSP
jgi:hypothetical protein